MATAAPSVAGTTNGAGAAARGGAAPGAAGAAFTRTQVRRLQRRSHVRALTAKLAREVQRRLAAEAAAGSCEVSQRLNLAAPVVKAGLQGTSPSALDQRRRNAALHCFSADASWIAKATPSQLNRLQREGAPKDLRRSGGSTGGELGKGTEADVHSSTGCQPCEFPASSCKGEDITYVGVREESSLSTHACNAKTSEVPESTFENLFEDEQAPGGIGQQQPNASATHTDATSGIAPEVSRRHQQTHSAAQGMRHGHVEQTRPKAERHEISEAKDEAVQHTQSGSWQVSASSSWGVAPRRVRVAEAAEQFCAEGKTTAASDYDWLGAGGQRWATWDLVPGLPSAAHQPQEPAAAQRPCSSRAAGVRLGFLGEDELVAVSLCSRESRGTAADLLQCSQLSLRLGRVDR
jgi:hypothetical protein